MEHIKLPGTPRLPIAHGATARTYSTPLAAPHPAALGDRFVAPSPNHEPTAASPTVAPWQPLALSIIQALGFEARTEELLEDLAAINSGVIEQLRMREMSKRDSGARRCRDAAWFEGAPDPDRAPVSAPLAKLYQVLCTETSADKQHGLSSRHATTKLARRIFAGISRFRPRTPDVIHGLAYSVCVGPRLHGNRCRTHRSPGRCRFFLATSARLVGGL